MNKLVKIVGLIAIVATLGLVAAAPALAEEPAPAPSAWQRMRQWFGGDEAPGAGQFVDEDGDGVCDVCGGQPGEAGYGRAYGAGGFVDEDGDGLCDVCGAAPGEGQRLAPADGTGNAYGRGQGVRGQAEFVDEDGDGICDLFGEMGQGRGQRGVGQKGGRAGGMMLGGNGS